MLQTDRTEFSDIMAGNAAAMGEPCAQMREPAAQMREPDDGLDRLLVGTSAAMRALRDTIRRIGPSDAAVLITGPSGAGKEMVARALHHASRRAAGAMVPVNCGAIPGDLIESELFGHEKGSFTGAIAQRRGRFEQASGGTLFLDEIGDMPLAMQVRLLRVLEDRAIERVGGTARIAVDTRIVAATHRDVDHAVAMGTFREDLYFRLAVFPLAVPALVERTGDIPALIAHFLCDVPAADRPRFGAEAEAVLGAHDWPGNVRELRNLVERARILFAGAEVDADGARRLLHPRGATTRPTATATASAAPVEDGRGGAIDLRAMVADLERRQIVAALDAARGVVADAARLVSLNRTTFLEKMRRHAVERPGLALH